MYVMTAVSRNPRMILGFDVAQDKTSQRIQQIVDSAPEARRYYTDGYSGYLDVVYPGQHIYNIHDKKDTFTVEGVNADLRHYIPMLARRSRCFPRKLETLYAVVEVFVAALIVLVLPNTTTASVIQRAKSLLLSLISFNRALWPLPVCHRLDCRRNRLYNV